MVIAQRISFRVPLLCAAVSILLVLPWGVAAEPQANTAFPSMRLLSQSQYTNTVAAIFGEHIVPNVRFVPVPRVGGLVAVGAREAIMTIGVFEPLENAARTIATRVVSEENRDLLIPCQPAVVGGRDDVCAREFLGRVGRLLFRRPLAEDELKEVVGIAGDTAAGAEDFYYGLSAALSYLLVSPKFLYIQETFEPDPAHPSGWRLDGYSTAARLSFLVWDAGPDDPLLEAVEHGQLQSPDGLGAQIDRLLASPRVEYGVTAFFDDMLVAEGFGILAKDPVIYPAFTSKVVMQAREQMLRTIVDHLVTGQGDYRDLFVTRRTFMTRDLAAVYGAPVDAGPNQWVPYEFPEQAPRGGMLTLVGFLARYSHPGKTSPTNRGRGLRETLLCQRVPDPPPNVNFELFENVTAERRTARQRLDAHNENPICAGCHRLTDPLGLVFERYDGAGQYRLTENGVEIDSSGDVNRVPVADAIELGRVLRDDPALTSCLVSRAYSYALGHEIKPGDRQFLLHLEERFAADGYRFLQLLRTIATSGAFQRVKAPAALLAVENRHAY